MNTSRPRPPAATRGAGGGESRSDRKRRAIIEAATHLFLELGYDGTSMDDVAARAAVSKPTVYNHFADKKQLYAAVIQQTVARIDDVVALVARNFEEPGNPAADLERLAIAFLNALMQSDVIRLRRLVIATANRFPDVARAWYDAGFRRVLRTLAETFLKLRERGTLAFTDAEFAASHFVGLLLWIPVNEAMFGGAEEPPSRGSIARQARLGVAAFLKGYAQ